jgi:hypothetical protein
MVCSFHRKKSRRFPRTAAFQENKKAADLAGPAALVFYVIPSKTPSGSPRSYEYYDAKTEKQAVRQRLMDHENTLSLKKLD